MVKEILMPVVLVTVLAALALWASLASWSVAALNWGLVSTLLLLVILALLMWSTGRQPINTMVISVTAALAALASLGRILFASLPSVQPVTFLVLLSGYVFGSGTGFIIGMLTGLISNFFLGHGPWTLWQMIAWGICGLLGGFLGRGRRDLALMPFLIMSVLAAFLFGIFLNTWHWLNLVYPLTWTTWGATWASSILFDTMHAAGNVIFAIIFARPFFNYLVRYRNRFLPIDDLTSQS